MSKTAIFACDGPNCVNSAIRKCGRCKLARYCGKGCQKKKLDRS